MIYTLPDIDPNRNINAHDLNCLVEAVKFFQTNDMASTALNLKLSASQLFEHMTYPHMQATYANSYLFSKFPDEPTTKGGKKRSPALATYLRKIGIINALEDDNITLSPLGKLYDDGKISLQSLCVLLLSKQRVKCGSVFETTILSKLCKYISFALNQNEEITLDKDKLAEILTVPLIEGKYDFSNLQTENAFEGRADLCFNEIISSGLFASNGKDYTFIKKFAPFALWIASQPIHDDLTDDSYFYKVVSSIQTSFVSNLLSADASIFPPFLNEIFNLQHFDDDIHSDSKETVEIEAYELNVFANKVFDFISKSSFKIELERKANKNNVGLYIIKNSSFGNLQMFASGDFDDIKRKEDGSYYQKNHQWFDDSITINDIVCHTSTDWTHDTYHRTFAMLKEYVENLTQGSFVVKDVPNGNKHHYFLCVVKKIGAINITPKSLQKIYYGAPGTGKSHEVKRITGETDGLTHKNVFRTTFHPDSDYASFVGCYKPIKGEKPLYGLYGKTTIRLLDGQNYLSEEIISYEFVPQTFTDAYVYAHNNPDTPTYLVIEEINRGNCAQVFGDLFQLLDRNSAGESEYEIKPDKDLAKHLAQEIYSNTVKPEKIKLRLPSNLYILATMNTSDQSLFPMDSAFKRRWDWEYVPISYDEPVSSQFTITIDGSKYKWVDFIKVVNEKILKLTQSEDKQMGNFFIKESIDEKQFKSKVMFYLWYEILRDEVQNSNYFFYSKEVDSNNIETTVKFTFKDLYEADASKKLKGVMKYLGVQEVGAAANNSTQP